LDPDSCDELLVGEGGEELARYGGGVQVELAEDDEEGEGDGEAGCDDEGEEDLGCVSDMLGIFHWGWDMGCGVLTPVPATPASVLVERGALVQMEELVMIAMATAI